MGTGIVKNLLKAGNRVTVYNRTKAHAEEVIAAGARWADSPAEATLNNEAVMVMVGFPADVEETYLGPKGIFSVVQPGQIVVDMTTSKPSFCNCARTSTTSGLPGLVNTPRWPTKSWWLAR